MDEEDLDLKSARKKPRILHEDSHTITAARGHLETAASQGDSQAMHLLGIAHYQGDPDLDITMNYGRCIFYLEQAASHGHMEAMFYLADLYLHGNAKDPSAEIDREKAIFYFEKAANLGHLSSILNLAMLKCQDESRENSERIATFSKETAIQYFEDLLTKQTDKHMLTLYYLGLLYTMNSANVETRELPVDSAPLFQKLFHIGNQQQFLDIASLSFN
jgi:TPR repeat protein